MYFIKMIPPRHLDLWELGETMYIVVCMVDVLTSFVSNTMACFYP